MYELYIKIKQVNAASKNPKISREVSWKLHELEELLRFKYNLLLAVKEVNNADNKANRKGR